eukprot:CAMPEP_0202701300 /NCGR_PEP_ID=MMETSP1385-20130828/14396_1 /ASSEMBLY_ACC=CAM_ASM_000861 /TAXON_ID=933848 /ORGANISM="Elphidium margaritaceum" /LENGTH=269 /DNA_ID=CAMNT_0049358689 /DNA_START=51 /DNA_END=860 /DNA_ORIENTATION=-
MLNLVEESVKAAIADSMDEEKNGLDANQVKKIWKDYMAKDSLAQCDSFLNVNWDTLQSKKEEIVKIYVQYADREQRCKPQPVGFAPFNLVLENLSKESVETVVQIVSQYGDRSSMAARFVELGLKLNNSKVSILEALLFIYGQQKNAFVALPPTPASAVLRNAEKNLQNVKQSHKDRENEIAQLKSDLDEGKVKKMKIANEQLRLKKLEEDFKKDGVAMKRELKKAEKEVEVAQEGLTKEYSVGTDASNYLKAEVENYTKQSASAKFKK